MKNYLPKGKADYNAIGILKTTSFEIVKPDMLELLTWFQDFNWGVANGVAEYLMPHVNDIEDEIIVILEGNDGECKRGILAGLVDKTPMELNTALRIAITKLAECPTKNDKDEEVDMIAKEIIAKRKILT